MLQPTTSFQRYLLDFSLIYQLETQNLEMHTYIGIHLTRPPYNIPNPAVDNEINYNYTLQSEIVLVTYLPISPDRGPLVILKPTDNQHHVRQIYIDLLVQT